MIEDLSNGDQSGIPGARMTCCFATDRVWVDSSLSNPLRNPINYQPARGWNPALNADNCDRQSIPRLQGWIVTDCDRFRSKIRSALLAFVVSIAYSDCFVPDRPIVSLQVAAGLKTEPILNTTLCDSDSFAFVQS
jgi:hypothetical protein